MIYVKHESFSTFTVNEKKKIHGVEFVQMCLNKVKEIWLFIICVDRSCEAYNQFVSKKCKCKKHFTHEASILLVFIPLCHVVTNV